MFAKEISALREKLADVSKRLADAQKVAAEAAAARTALLKSIANLEAAGKGSNGSSRTARPDKRAPRSHTETSVIQGAFVRDSIDRMHGEFSVFEIIEDLMAHCPELQEPPDQVKVSNALRRLRLKNYIKVSQRGTQRKPNRYVRCLAGPNLY